MKLKNSIILIVALLLITPTMAQKHSAQYKPAPRGSYSQNSYIVDNASKIEMIYGIAAGVSCPQLKFSGNGAVVSLTPGFKAGIMWGVDWGRYELVPELWYSSFSMDFEDGASNVKGAELRSKNLDFPIMFGIEIYGPLRISFGPSFSLMSNNKITTKSGDSYEFEHIKGSVGYAAGVSCDIYNNLFIDVRYVGLFSSSTTEYFGSSSTSDTYNIRMYTIDITAGFRF